MTPDALFSAACANKPGIEAQRWLVHDIRNAAQVILGSAEMILHADRVKNVNWKWVAGIRSRIQATVNAIEILCPDAYAEGLGNIKPEGK